MRRHSGVHRPAKLQRAWLTARPPRQIASWLPRGSLAGGQTCCGSLKRAPQVRNRTLPRVAGSVDTAAAPGSGHVIACRCGRSRIRANGRRSSPERTSPRIGPRNGGRRIFRPRPFSTPGPCRPPVRSEARFPRGERLSYYVLCIPELLQEGKTPGRAVPDVCGWETPPLPELERKVCTPSCVWKRFSRSAASPAAPAGAGWRY